MRTLRRSVLTVLVMALAAPLASAETAIQQWQDAKFGLFIHWGTYSIPAGIWKGEQIQKLGEQIQRHAKIPQDEYAKLAKSFNPVNFDADKWVAMAKRAGMKYIVITSKHHDGFNMFHTKLSDYNIVDATPFGRDVVKELADACARGGLKFGVYYSTPDWNFPGAIKREIPNEYSVFETVTPEHEEYMLGQLEELLTGYGPLFEIFFDMGRPTLEQSKKFADTVHRLQPNCLASGRVMNNQGDFLTMPDNKLPQEPIGSAWETPGTFYHTWGYKSWVERPDPEQQTKNQIRKLVDIVSMGGNFLLNVGPLSDGTILDYEVDILDRIGKWVDVNAEAIYETSPNPFKRFSFGGCTQKDGMLYIHVLDWPENGKVILPGLRNKVQRAYMLADSAKKPLRQVRNGLDVEISLPAENDKSPVIVVAVEYAGKLDIQHPLTRQNESGSVILAGDDALSHGVYSGMQYNSLTQDHSKSWDFSVNVSGLYEMELEYKLGDEHSYIFTVARESIDTDLAPTGKNSTKKSIGTVKLAGKQRHTLTVAPSPRDNRNEKGHLRSIGMRIESIRLRPAVK